MLVLNEQNIHRCVLCGKSRLIVNVKMLGNNVISFVIIYHKCTQCLLYGKSWLREEKSEPSAGRLAQNHSLWRILVEKAA